METPSAELPEAVTAALRAHPKCSLSISESLSFKATSAESTGTSTTTREYYLQCPHQDPVLLERSTAQRAMQPGEALGGMLGGSGLGAILGGGGGLGRGWPPGLEAVLPHWQQGSSSGPPQHPPQPQAPPQGRRPPVPGAIQV